MSQSVSVLLAVPAELNPDGVRVRMYGTTKKPEFVLADLCRYLELKNPAMVAERFDDDEKGIRTIDTPSGVQEMLVITEPGLYRLLATTRQKQSDDPVVQARNDRVKRFQRWLYHEVLPAIREFGCYPPPAESDPARDPIIRNCREIIELRTAQLEFEHRLAQTETALVNVARLADAAMQTATSNHGYFSVLGFARRNGWEMPREIAAAHGKALSSLCRQLGAEIGKVTDARYGSVNTYPESVLRDYFAGKETLTH